MLFCPRALCIEDSEEHGIHPPLDHFRKSHQFFIIPAEVGFGSHSIGVGRLGLLPIQGVLSREMDLSLRCEVNVEWVQSLVLIDHNVIIFVEIIQDLIPDFLMSLDADEGRFEPPDIETG